MADTPSMKILFLHGYTQSGPLFNAKTKALQKTLQKSFPGTTFSFPTGPIKLTPADLPGEPVSDPSKSAETGDFYGWWRRDPTTMHPVGLESTWVFLKEHLEKEGPFAGVIGFSQGAALAALLASSLEPGRERPTELKTLNHPPLKFCVSYSGFRVPGAEKFGGLYEPKIATPVLHYLGSLDAVVDEKRSLALVEVCREETGKKVVYHPGGHFLPGGKQFVAQLVGFVRECLSVGGEKGKKEEEERVEDMDPFASHGRL